MIVKAGDRVRELEAEMATWCEGPSCNDIGATPCRVCAAEAPAPVPETPPPTREVECPHCLMLFDPDYAVEPPSQAKPSHQCHYDADGNPIDGHEGCGKP
jgi:hypothetical protein